MFLIGAKFHHGQVCQHTDLKRKESGYFVVLELEGNFPLIKLSARLSCYIFLCDEQFCCKLSRNSVMFPDARDSSRFRISKLHRLLSKYDGSMTEFLNPEKSRTWRDVMAARASGIRPDKIALTLRYLRLVVKPPKPTRCHRMIKQVDREIEPLKLGEVKVRERLVCTCKLASRKSKDPE
jgi:hypothetical protein